jgi:hypothetical protein
MASGQRSIAYQGKRDRHGEGECAAMAMNGLRPIVLCALTPLTPLFIKKKRRQGSLPALSLMA